MKVQYDGKTHIGQTDTSMLKEKYKTQIKENIKTVTKDENGFVRIDPRFLTNI